MAGNSTELAREEYIVVKFMCFEFLKSFRLHFYCASFEPFRPLSCSFTVLVVAIFVLACFFLMYPSPVLEKDHAKGNWTGKVVANSINHFQL